MYGLCGPSGPSSTTTSIPRSPERNTKGRGSGYKNPNPRPKPFGAIAMANSSLEKHKEFWNPQINDEHKWALNSKLLRSLGLFVVSIFLMRNFGELMVI